MTNPMHLVIAGAPLEASLLSAWFRNSYTPDDLTISLVTKAEDAKSRVHQLNFTNLGIITHLGLDEKAFMKLTGATFNLGTWFKGWQDSSHHYFQPFGTHGGPMDFVSFQHYLFKKRGFDKNVSYEDYSLSCVAASKCKFTHPKSDPTSIASTIGYSLAIDEQATVKGLMGYLAETDVTFYDADISFVKADGESIQTLELSDGTSVSGTMFIDCTGQARSLIKSLNGFEHKACKRLGSYTVADFTIKSDSELKPYSEVHNTASGWFRIDQSQAVTAGQFIGDESLSEQDVINAVQAAVPNADVSVTSIESFVSGRLENLWLGNCVAMGETAANYEPLDCSPLHSLIAQSFRLLDLFPRSENVELQRFELNRKAVWWHDNIRDFNLLRHAMRNSKQSLTKLIDTDLPSSLKHKLSLYQSNGQVADSEEEPFHDDYLTATMIGLQLYPNKYNPLLESFDFAELNTRFNAMRDKIGLASDIMPNHQDYLARYLSAN